ncbi:TfuA-like protein [Streptomyces sp. WMMC940]|uniref:TfuA-like protein n=1 Tax=Streptomyces sp. WMMC940 TaxID=3015153 RepID=UPI0022B635FE|nr:TfuA-like protein [Streptomyces sp. WMMC940]MCZ7456292.1 TfuA-like protein [Streptomyces sp. WMMC940]
MKHASRLVVTAGPTISREEVRGVLPEAEVRGPVAADQVLRWEWNAGDTLVVIDGVFLQSRAVRHKELLALLDRGVTVYGASSMGALRAAELEAFGMRGVVEVFRSYRDGVLVGDDEVALTHADAEAAYRPTSWALVDLRDAAGRAARDGAVDERTARTIVEAAKSLPFTARDDFTILDAARQRGCRAPALDAFRAYCAAQGPGAGVKHRDAVTVLALAAAEAPTSGTRAHCSTRSAGLRYRGTPVRLATTTHLRRWTPTPTPTPTPSAAVDREREAAGPAQGRPRDDEVLTRLALDWPEYPAFQRSAAAECLLLQTLPQSSDASVAEQRRTLSSIVDVSDHDSTHLDWEPLALALGPRLPDLGLPSSPSEAGDALTLLRETERDQPWPTAGPLLAVRLWLGDPRVDRRTPLIERLQASPAYHRALAALADARAETGPPVNEPTVLRDVCRSVLLRWGVQQPSDIPAVLRDHGFTDIDAMVGALRTHPRNAAKAPGSRKQGAARTIPRVDRRSARADWERNGCVLLSGVLDVERVKAMATEAHEQIGKASTYERDDVSCHRDGSFASPAHFSLLPAGPLLQQLAFDEQLLTALREATGIPELVPQGGSVVVHHHGDFQGLHTDTAKATVTVGIALTERMPPMWWAPSLRGATPDDLTKVVADKGFWPECAGFERLEPPPADGSVRAFAGNAIPHWRTPYPGEEPGLLATLTYTDPRGGRR